MKFLLVKDKIINVDLITQIFIIYHDDEYQIIIFYEGYDYTESKKSKQFITYKKFKTKKEAEEELNFLVNKLNSC